MKHKYEQTASKSIKETESVGGLERHTRTVCLTGWTGTLPTTPLIHLPNDVWPVREKQPNYIQDYKAFVRGFLSEQHPAKQ